MPMPSGTTLVIEMWTESEPVEKRTLTIKKPRLDLNDDPTYVKGQTALAKATAIAQSGVFLTSKQEPCKFLANFYYETTTKTPIVSPVQAKEHIAERAKAKV